MLAKVLTVSDGVAEGVREDKSGAALVAPTASTWSRRRWPR
jgi:molybdopterin biosynthesis enzyme MoaB